MSVCPALTATLEEITLSNRLDQRYRKHRDGRCPSLLGTYSNILPVSESAILQKERFTLEILTAFVQAATYLIPTCLCDSNTLSVVQIGPVSLSQGFITALSIVTCNITGAFLIWKLQHLSELWEDYSMRLSGRFHRSSIWNVLSYFKMP
jgi:hypothetical protein